MKDEYYLDPRVAERYDAEVGENFLGDRDFYLGLAREAAQGGHPVLELAVGTGRVAIVSGAGRCRSCRARPVPGDARGRAEQGSRSDEPSPGRG